MPTVQDIKIKKPSEQQAEKCRSWPIWQSKPSTFEWAYTEKETCLVLEGKVTVKDDSGEVTFGPGEMVEFPKGLECLWQVKEPVKKHYTFG